MGVLSRFKAAESEPHVVGTDAPTDADDPAGRMHRRQQVPLMGSPQQQRIFDWFATTVQSQPNLVVRARAGTGKTTTIIEGIRRAPESNILLSAFNKRIADELNSRLSNPNAQAKTLHALGFAAVRENRQKVRVLSGSERADALTRAAFGRADVPKDIFRLVSMLHTKVRELRPIGASTDVIEEVAYQFNFIPDEAWGKLWTLERVVAVVKAAVAQAAHEPSFTGGGIDFADMIFLPLVNAGWLRPTYDLVVIDEAQDMSDSQLLMCRRVARGRLAVVGDDRQAIYGFRGADSTALDRMKRKLGALELPLTVTYRCGHSIVERAQRLVPDITAAPDNPQGTVNTVSFDAMMALVQPGDFVLSRLNAPLVAVTLNLLAQRKRAFMLGRDVGQGVLSVIKQLKLFKGASCDELLTAIDEWARKRTTKLAARGMVDLADRARDQADMIRALAATALDADDVAAQCNLLFQDLTSGDAVMCSSVHKAKGLETERVWVLMDTLYRRGTSLEEENIHYVAVTRAKSELNLVSARV